MPESCRNVSFPNLALFRDVMADLAHDDRENTVLNEANVRMLSPPRPPPHESEDSELMAAFREFRVFRVVGRGAGRAQNLKTLKVQQGCFAHTAAYAIST